MSTGIGWFLLGIFLDAISLVLQQIKVTSYITAPLGLISVILMIIGIVKLNKYDKVIEIGRNARMNKKRKK